MRSLWVAVRLFNLGLNQFSVYLDEENYTNAYNQFVQLVPFIEQDNLTNIPPQFLVASARLISQADKINLPHGISARSLYETIDRFHDKFEKCDLAGFYMGQGVALAREGKAIEALDFYCRSWRVAENPEIFYRIHQLWQESMVSNPEERRQGLDLLKGKVESGDWTLLAGLLPDVQVTVINELDWSKIDLDAQPKVLNLLTSRELTPFVRELRFKRCFGLRHEILLAILHTAEQLSSLEIEECNELKKIVMPAGLKGRVTLKRCRKLVTLEVPDMMKSQPKINFIGVEDCEKFDKRVLWTLKLYTQWLGRHEIVIQPKITLEACSRLLGHWWTQPEDAVVYYYRARLLNLSLIKRGLTISEKIQQLKQVRQDYCKSDQLGLCFDYLLKKMAGEIPSEQTMDRQKSARLNNDLENCFYSEQAAVVNRLNALESLEKAQIDRVPAITTMKISVAAAAVQDLAQVICHNHQLRKIDLSKTNFFEQEPLDFLMKALATHPSITWLILDKCDVDDQGLCRIADWLRGNRVLKTLSLRDNRFGHLGIEYLAKALSLNRTLQQLDLGENNITEKGIEGMADAIRGGTHLKRIVLGCDVSGMKMAGYLARAVESSAIEELDLEGGCVAAEDLECLKNALRMNQHLTRLVISRDPSWNRWDKTDWRIWSSLFHEIDRQLQMNRYLSGKTEDVETRVFRSANRFTLLPPPSGKSKTVTPVLSPEGPSSAGSSLH